VTRATPPAAGTQRLDAHRVPLAGLQMIEASAGTGKTFTITTLVLRLVLERGLAPDEIVVVTFTRAATAELAARLRERLAAALAAVEHGLAAGALPALADADLVTLLAARADHWPADHARLQRAVGESDRLQVSTIHGFAQRVLQRQAFETGSPLDGELVEGDLALLDDAATDVWTRACHAAPGWWIEQLRERVTSDTAKLIADDAAAAAVCDPALRVACDRRGLVEVVRAMERAPDAELWPVVPDALAAAFAAAYAQTEAAVAARVTAWAAAAELWAAPVAAGALGSPGRAAGLGGGDAATPTCQGDALLATLAALREQGVFSGSLLSDKRLTGLRVQLPPLFVPVGSRGDHASRCAMISAPMLLLLARTKLQSLVKKGRTAPESPLLTAIDRYVAADRSAWLAGERARQLWLRLRVDEVQQALEQRKTGNFTFGDLLLRLDAALAHPSRGRALVAALRAQVGAVLIDEFQDTDAVQYRIFRALATDPDGAAALPMFLIGDPKQAIYRFRGGDIHTYLRARADAGAAIHTMTTNWRSDAPLLRAIAATYTRAPRPFGTAAIGFVEVDPKPGSPQTGRLVQRDTGEPATPMVWRWVGGDPARAARGGVAKSTLVHEAIAATVNDVHDDLARLGIADAEGRVRPVTPADMAVLADTHRNAAAMQRALVQHGIPTVLHSDASVFASDEADTVLALLVAIADPARRRAVRALLASPIHAWDGEQLLALAGDDTALDAVTDGLLEARRRWAHGGGRGLARALDGYFERFAVIPRLLGQAGGERRVTNVLHLVELLQREALVERRSPAALIAWLRGMQLDTRARPSDDAQLRLEQDAAALTILTIHRSKGLEFPLVYCPFLWVAAGARKAGSSPAVARMAPARDTEDGVDGVEGGGGTKVIDLGSERAAAVLAQQALEERQERMRLAYVALTRARHRVAVVWGPAKDLQLAGLSAALYGEDPATAGADVVPAAGGDGAAPAPIPDVRMRGALAELVAAHPDVMELTDARARRPVLRTREFAADDGGVLRMPRARPFTAALPQPLRRASFSGLTRDDRAGDVEPPDAPDHDPLDANPEGETELLTLDDVTPAPDPAAVASLAEPVPLAELRAGRVPGELVHKAFELADFPALAQLEPAEAAARVRASIATPWLARGLPPADVERLALQVPRIGVTPLPLALRGAGHPAVSVRLCELGPSARWDELPFTVPLAEAGARGLAATDLAAALRRGGVDEAYAQRVAALPVHAVRGALVGFIDLVAQWDGRYVVVDYKSNRLGSSFAAYHPDALAREMAAHHYVLQAYLYVLAVHRLLAARLTDYDYDTHMGGAAYLFLRGLDPDHGQLDGERRTGVWFHRPPRAAIEGLSRVIDAPERGLGALPQGARGGEHAAGAAGGSDG
jgi:exodeoxyribonuclease V beta subunit